MILQEVPNLFNNPAVTQAGIAGVIVLVLLGIMYRMFTRLDDTIHGFIVGQASVNEHIDKAAVVMAEALRDSVENLRRDLRTDNLILARDIAEIKTTLNILKDRGDRTFEQVAVHRGVVEPPATGTSPAIINPPRGV